MFFNKTYVLGTVNDSLITQVFAAYGSGYAYITSTNLKSLKKRFL